MATTVSAEHKRASNMQIGSQRAEFSGLNAKHTRLTSILTV